MTLCQAPIAIHRVSVLRHLVQGTEMRMRKWSGAMETGHMGWSAAADGVNTELTYIRKDPSTEPSEMANDGGQMSGGTPATESMTSGMGAASGGQLHRLDKHG